MADEENLGGSLKPEGSFSRLRGKVTLAQSPAAEETGGSGAGGESLHSTGSENGVEPYRYF